MTEQGVLARQRLLNLAWRFENANSSTWSESILLFSLCMRESYKINTFNKVIKHATHIIPLAYFYNTDREREREIDRVVFLFSFSHRK